MTNPPQEKGPFATIGRVGMALMAIGSLLTTLSKLPNGYREARQAVRAIRRPNPVTDAGNSAATPTEEQ